MMLSRSLLSIPISKVKMLEDFTKIRLENNARSNLSFPNSFLAFYVCVAPVRDFPQKGIFVCILYFPVPRVDVRHASLLSHSNRLCWAITHIHTLRPIDAKMLDNLQQDNRIGL